MVTAKVVACVLETEKVAGVILLFELNDDDDEIEAEMPSTTSAEMCPVAVTCALALMIVNVIIKIAAAVVKIAFFMALSCFIFDLLNQI